MEGSGLENDLMREENDQINGLQESRTVQKRADTAGTPLQTEQMREENGCINGGDRFQVFPFGDDAG